MLRNAFLLAAALQACAGTEQQAKPAEQSSATLKGPEITADGARVAHDRDAACAANEKNRIPEQDLGAAAHEAGMLPDDFSALLKTCDQLDVTVSFRDSNKSCEPHLREGMESKGHDVLTKTFTHASLPPEFAYLAGTVSTLSEKPKPGEILKDPLSKRYLTKDGKPLTCDYDLMDVLAKDGGRVIGETSRDLSVRQALNDGLPLRGTPPHRVERVKHGAQAEYPAYLRAMVANGHHEPPILDLLKPEAPITVLDHEGHVYRLKTVEDDLNYYRCVGAPLPPEWNVHVTGSGS